VISCGYSAHFLNEAGQLLNSQAGTLGYSMAAQGPMLSVVSLPGVAGLGGQKGSLQIAHTCGYGNLMAKLIALESATGFSSTRRACRESNETMNADVNRLPLRGVG
jgi:hypothetical protein